jgi:HAD superfamily hydrolase (TIGR01509 family)
MADLSQIAAVSLDAGGVLVFPNWQRVSDALARQRIRVTAAALRQAEPAARFALDDANQVASSNDAKRGGLYFDLVLDSAGVPRGSARDRALADVYGYHATRNLWEDVPEDVPDALERLRARGFRLVVASNANGVLQRSLERQGLEQYFDAVCDSCIEGVEKPDPRFFSIVVGRAGSSPHRTLHVGDLYHVDIVGARRAGLHATLLDPHDLYAGIESDRIHRLGELLERLPAVAARVPD